MLLQFKITVFYLNIYADLLKKNFFLKHLCCSKVQKNDLFDRNVL